MKPIARPVYLDLLRIHLPLPGWVSILHRVSGVLLFAALPLGVWGLSVSLSDEAGFQRMAYCATHPLARLLLLHSFTCRLAQTTDQRWNFPRQFYALRPRVEYPQ